MTRAPATPEDIQDLRLRASMTTAEAARLCGVTTRTWQRYEKGSTRISPAAFQLLIIHATKCLPCAGKSWEGWRFWNDQLWSPENLAFNPGDIRATPYLHALLAELRAQLGKPDLEINRWTDTNLASYPSP